MQSYEYHAQEPVGVDERESEGVREKRDEDNAQGVRSVARERETSQCRDSFNHPHLIHLPFILAPVIHIALQPDLSLSSPPPFIILDRHHSPIRRALPDISSSDRST